MRYFYYLILLCLTLLTSCTRLVGGPCEGESHFGVAHVVSVENGKVLARFDPGDSSFTTSKLPFSPGAQYTVKHQIKGESGTLYPAQLALITKGSCTPENFSLIATEEMSRGIFLPFDQEGQIEPESTQKIGQLSTIFKKLESSWPDLTVTLCGQTHREGTEEYNLDLGNRYARIVADQLGQNGVTGDKVTTISFGEVPCPQSNFFPDDVRNGIWFNFYLTEKSANAAKDRRDFEMLTEQAHRGDKLAQYHLANFYAGGRGVEQDFSQAFYWFKKSAEQGLGEAQLLVGLSYFIGMGTEKDRSEAAKWFEKAAEAGSADATYQMGLVYLLGAGRPRNEEKGLEYLRDAARLGNQEALDFFERAAEQNDTMAQLFLAQLYTYGAGVQQNATKAMNLYQQAATAGDSDAMFLLGQAYHDGNITAKNPEKALFWYQKAAESGNSSAWYRLGVLYETGEAIVPRDRDKAIFWYTKAAAAGFEDAKIALEELKKEDSLKKDN
jgi:TPR repeat protein/outer membrane protein OmpA-like peptidoglycan-associated protein